MTENGRSRLDAETLLNVFGKVIDSADALSHYNDEVLLACFLRVENSGDDVALYVVLHLGHENRGRACGDTCLQRNVAAVSAHYLNDGAAVMGLRGVADASRSHTEESLALEFTTLVDGTSRALLTTRPSHYCSAAPALADVGPLRKACRELGIYKVSVVANKIRSESDEEFIRERIPEDALLGFIHFNEEVIDADRNGLSPYDVSAGALEEIRRIKEKIDSRS